MQEIAWYITVILIGLLAVVFARVLWTSNTELPYDEVARRAYRFRGLLFWVVISVGVIIALATLNPWPHASVAAGAGAEIVDATGSQWRWDLSRTQFHAGETVEFRVTSLDVNHGFGIYDHKLQLLAQVQAMPGYTNVLRYTFTRPGRYQILCLEYCGVAHHDMRATLTVLPTENNYTKG